MNFFESLILGEAAPPQQGQTPPANNAPQQQNNPNGVQMPDEPPDITAQQPEQAPEQQTQQDPNTQQDAQDPNNVQQQGDPNDPNAMQDQNQLQGPNSEIEQAEQNTFSDLKPEQMDIKIRELKTQYKVLHNNILDTLEKINKVSHTTYDDGMLDFIVRKLIALKNITRDSLNDTFPTRTYVENKFEFQRLVLIFNLIANMLTEIYKSRIKRREKIDEITSKENKKKEPADFPTLYKRNAPEE